MLRVIDAHASVVRWRCVAVLVVCVELLEAAGCTPGSVRRETWRVSVAVQAVGRGGAQLDGLLENVFVGGCTGLPLRRY